MAEADDAHRLAARFVLQAKEYVVSGDARFDVRCVIEGQREGAIRQEICRARERIDLV
jgi:hypothetical protein